MMAQSKAYAVLACGLMVFATGLAACGGDDDDSSGGSSGSSNAGGENNSAAGSPTQTEGGAANQPGAGGDSSGGAAPTNGACTQPVIGTWKAGGKSYAASQALYVGLYAKFNLTMVACDGSDATMEFETIPMLAVGSYPLTFTILHGKPANGDGGAVFMDTKGNENYFTDDTHTGTFKITKVDAAAKTFSADFEFTGKADDGKTLEITDGHITAAPYNTQ